MGELGYCSGKYEYGVYFGENMTTRKRIKQTTPLVIEPHPTDYSGYPFITLLQFCQDRILCIIDNTTEKMIKAYVLDFCTPTGVDEEAIIEIAEYWFNNTRDQYPLSIEFSKRGLSGDFSKIYRNYNIEYITRAIGPVPKYDMGDSIQIRRRRKKVLPKDVGLKLYTFD